MFSLHWHSCHLPLSSGRWQQVHLFAYGHVIYRTPNAGVASITLKNFMEPNVLIAVHDQWDKFANPIKTNASGATSTQIDNVLERLQVELHKLKELPCCMDAAQHTLRPIPSYV